MKMSRRALETSTPTNTRSSRGNGADRPIKLETGDMWGTDDMMKLPSLRYGQRGPGDCWERNTKPIGPGLNRGNEFPRGKTGITTGQWPPDARQAATGAHQNNPMLTTLDTRGKG